MSRFLPELRRLVGANRVTLRPSAAALLTGPIRSNILSKSAAEYDELVARIAQYNSLKEATKDFRYAKYQPGYEDHVAAPNFADYRARIVDQELVNRVEKFYLDAKKRRTSSQPSLPEGWGDLVTALGTPSAFLKARLAGTAAEVALIRQTARDVNQLAAITEESKGKVDDILARRPELRQQFLDDYTDHIAPRDIVIAEQA